jgi:hypothetical protein
MLWEVALEVTVVVCVIWFYIDFIKSIPTFKEDIKPILCHENNNLHKWDYTESGQIFCSICQYKP